MSVFLNTYMREMLTCFANQNSYISSLDKGLINFFPLQIFYLFLKKISVKGSIFCIVKFEFGIKERARNDWRTGGSVGLAFSTEAALCFK